MGDLLRLLISNPVGLWVCWRQVGGDLFSAFAPLLRPLDLDEICQPQPQPHRLGVRAAGAKVLVLASLP